VNKILDRILVLYVILVSSNPFVGYYHKSFILPVLMLVLLRYRKRVSEIINFQNTSLFFIIFVFFYEIIHSFIFSNFNILNSFRIVFELILALLIIKVTSINFLRLFVTITFYLTILSLTLYPFMFTPIAPFLMNVASDIFYIPESDLGYIAPTFILYTFDWTFVSGLSNALTYRNAGFTWEAGSFANFLNMALFLNIFLCGGRRRLISIKNLIFILGIISTFSTTGYLIMFIIILYSVWENQKQVLLRIISVVFLVTFALFLFNSAYFLKNKIENQLQEASFSQNRFGSALLDFRDFVKRPIFGWSRDTAVLFGPDTGFEAHRPNGLTNLLRSYGLFYTLVFFILIYNSFKKMAFKSGSYNSSKFAFMLFFIIIIGSFSQLIFDKPFFKSMVFWGQYIFIYQYYSIEKRDSIIKPSISPL
jgi:hypothetical protein